MTSELKCPVCNARLKPIGGFYTCSNDHREWAGTKELWQSLEIAMKALKKIAFDPAQYSAYCADVSKYALEQIEHKE